VLKRGKNTLTSSNTLAVTAASGNLGAEVVKAAIERVEKQNVVGLARTPAKAASLDIEIRPGDYDSRKELENSLRGIDSVLLVSGMASPDERIEQHRNVIEAAKSVWCSQNGLHQHSGC
jgi:NAD(P)H dehydrogenase (quinone)